MRKLIVFDSSHPLAVNNKCFEPSYALQGAGYFFWAALFNEAVKNNFQCVTSDIYLAQSNDIDQVAFCISEMVTPNTTDVIKKGAIPIICFSLESPLIARNFYHFMDQYCSKFLHVFQFDGTRKRLEKTSTMFHTMNFPVYSRTVKSDVQWSEKKYLVIINSNKRAFYYKFNKIGNTLHSLASHLKFMFFKLIDPWMRVREIYIDRIYAIKYFSVYKDFCLYGHGWNEDIPGFGKKYKKAAMTAWKGALGNELETKLNAMNQFKFSICFENCNFPGYITEKIFDSFLAGCIPIYYGAPDIKKFVPEETFIDYTLFNDMKALDNYLHSISESQAQNYLIAAEKFLNSSEFDKFHVDNVVKSMVDVVVSQIQK